MYIAAGSVYCPLFADDICAVAFSVWPLLLKETLPLCSLASHVEGDTSALFWHCLRRSASSLASLLWRSLELMTSKKRLGECTRHTFSHIELTCDTLKLCLQIRTQRVHLQCVQTDKNTRILWDRTSCYSGACVITTDW